MCDTIGMNNETDPNQCDSDPCQNGGTCIDDLNFFTCECPNGVTGPVCENGEAIG